MFCVCCPIDLDLEVVSGREQKRRPSLQPMVSLVLAGLEVEAHDVRLPVPGAVAIWVGVAGAAVDAFDRLLLGFYQFHVNDGHLCDHLRTKN